MKRASIVTQEIDVARLIDAIRSPDHGAISVFVGTVREVNEGRSVSGMEYSAYTAMADEEMERIVGEAESAFGVSAVLVEHRIGVLDVGETSIAIVCAHAHRAAAMDSTRYIIEEIKKRVPIWKMEHYTDGTREWVDPTRSAGEIFAA
jgi:molybdopterin synthase catalytic subunit